MDDHKTIFQNIRDYLPLILLIAPFLGGLSQLYELSKISIAYIRFFSVSQLLSDGYILILFLTLIFIVPFFFSYVKESLKKGFY